MTQTDVIDQIDIDQTDIEKADAQTTDTKKTDIKKTDAEKTDIKKTDIEKTVIDQTVIDHTEAEKTDIDKTDGKKKKKIWEKIRRYLPAVLVIIAVIFLAKYIDIGELRKFLDQNERLGFFVCYLAYVVLGVACLSPDPITIMVIAWKGPVPAIILKVLGDTTLSLIDYYFGTSISDVADLEKQKSKLPFNLGKLPVDSPKFMLLVRLVPGIGGKFASVGAGAYRVPMKTYLWTTVVINLLGAIFLCFGGYQVIQKIPGFPGGKKVSWIGLIG